MADSPGGLLAQGMDNLSAGYQQFQGNLQTDAAMRGLVDQMLSSGGPGGISSLSPNGQALATKYMNGKNDRSTMMQLMGEAAASHILQENQQKAAMNAANVGATNAQSNAYNSDAFKNVSEGNYNAAQAAMLNAKINMMNRPLPAGGTPTAASIMSYGGQQGITQGGTGSPAPQPKGGQVISPPTPYSVTDPEVQAMMPMALKSTFGDPDKATAVLQANVDAMNKRNADNYQMQAGKQSLTGNLYFKRTDYKDGMPQMDVYSPEMVTGAGTVAATKWAGTQEFTVPHGQAPGQPVVKYGTNEPDTTATTEGYNTNDPAWQADLATAYQQSAASSNNLAKAKLLVDAVGAYNSGDAGRWNAIMGDPKYAQIKQIVTGTNPLNGLQMAMGYNTNNVLGQIKSANGSVGGRILQNEYETAKDVNGKAPMDGPTLYAAAQNLYNIADRQNSMDRAYALNRETMPSGQAEKEAVSMFGAPPNLVVSSGPSVAGKPSTTPPPNNPMVQIKTPDGRLLQIPSNNLPAALKLGAQQVPQ